MDCLLRVTEVCRRVGLSRSMVYARIAIGTFPRPVRVGKKAVRWRASEVAAWIDSRPRATGDLGRWPELDPDSDADID